MKKPTARQIAIHLTNLYYNTDYKFYSLFHRDAAIKAYIDELWEIYGPKEDTDEPMGVNKPVNRGIGST